MHSTPGNPGLPLPSYTEIVSKASPTLSTATTAPDSPIRRTFSEGDMTLLKLETPMTSLRVQSPSSQAARSPSPSSTIISSLYLGSPLIKPKDIHDSLFEATRGIVTEDPDPISTKELHFSQFYSPKTCVPTGLPETLERVAYSLSNGSQDSVKETVDELLDLAETTRWLTRIAETRHELPVSEESDGMKKYCKAVAGLLEEYLCVIISVKEGFAELGKTGVKEGVGKRMGSALICFDAFETKILQAADLDIDRIDEVAQAEFGSLSVGEAYFKVLCKLL